MKRLLVLFAALATAVAACDSNNSGGSAASKIDPQGVLVFGVPLEGSGISQRLQPDLSTSVCDFTVIQQIFSTLVNKNTKTGEAEPGLAQSWDIVDPSTVRFHLRPNLTFQDGTKLDATAAKTALDKNRAKGSPIASLMSDIDSITVDSSTTFTVRTKGNSAAIVPLTLAGREGAISAASSTDSHPVGAGPFMFDSQTVGARITLKKFDGYWNADKVKLAGIEFVNVSTQAGPNALAAGDVDIVTGNPDINAGLEGKSGVEIVSQPGLGYTKLNFNYSRGPWGNVKFRQAVNYAIDREAIAKVLFGGKAEIAWMPFPRRTAQYTAALARKYPYDVSKAKALIAESGLPTPIKTSMVTPAGISSYQRFAEIVQAQLAAIGVDVSINPSTNLLQDYRIDQKYDFSTSAWSPRPDPSATIVRQFGPNELQNSGNYRNPKLDAAIEKIQSSADAATQEKGYDEANTIVVDEALEVAIAFPEISYPRRTWVVGDMRMNENCQGVDASTLAITTDKP